MVPRPTAISKQDRTDNYTSRRDTETQRGRRGLSASPRSLCVSRSYGATSKKRRSFSRSMVVFMVHSLSKSTSGFCLLSKTIARP